jgi:hypothetical protein
MYTALVRRVVLIVAPRRWAVAAWVIARTSNPATTVVRVVMSFSQVFSE